MTDKTGENHSLSCKIAVNRNETMIINSSIVVTADDHYISVLNCARSLLCLFDDDVIFRFTLQTVEFGWFAVAVVHFL